MGRIENGCNEGTALGEWRGFHESERMDNLSPVLFGSVPLGQETTLLAPGEAAHLRTFPSRKATAKKGESAWNCNAITGDEPAAGQGVARPSVPCRLPVQFRPGASRPICLALMRRRASGSQPTGLPAKLLQVELADRAAGRCLESRRTTAVIPRRIIPAAHRDNRRAVTGIRNEDCVSPPAAVFHVEPEELVPDESSRRGVPHAAHHRHRVP